MENTELDYTTIRRNLETFAFPSDEELCTEVDSMSEDEIDDYIKEEGIDLEDAMKRLAEILALIRRG